VTVICLREAFCSRAATGEDGVGAGDRSTLDARCRSSLSAEAWAGEEELEASKATPRQVDTPRHTAWLRARTSW
jgi:hypothetical protein